jgi:cholesterol transport system auxiliary component
MNRRLTLLPLLIVMLIVMLFGCAGRGRQIEIAQYDLGDPGSNNNVAASRVAYLRSIQVKAPPWLDTTAMQYRLGYAKIAQRHSYAESRWAAPPGLLVEHWLRQNLLADAPSGECGLQIELDEFMQNFTDGKSSQAAIRLRVMLLPPRGGAPLAGNTFVIARDAASADAAGGVAAHVAALRDLTVQLQSWLKQVGDEPLRVPAQCAANKS